MFATDSLPLRLAIKRYLFCNFRTSTWVAIAKLVEAPVFRSRKNKMAAILLWWEKDYLRGAICRLNLPYIIPLKAPTLETGHIV